MPVRSAALAVALTAYLFALAACKRDVDAASAPAPVAQTQAPAAPQAAPAMPAPAPAAFDAAAFAGTFGGTLPCIDCPGIDTTIAFAADGAYTMSEVYQDGDSSSFVTKGTWTVQQDGRTLQLHPADAGERDHWLEILSANELGALDQEGKALGDRTANTLRRR